VPTAAAYLNAASSIDLFEIRSSELAQQRGSARVREFAAMMIRAHRGTSAQLSLAGRRINLLPDGTMLPRHAAMIAELEVSVNFDVAYRRQQVAAHEEALALHANYAARGTSPTLKPVAASAAGIVRSHLATVRGL
jgi:putative membrane protein